MFIPDFNLHRPDKLEEACPILNESSRRSSARGEQDLLLNLKLGKRHHKNVISLTRITELSNTKIFLSPLLVRLRIALAVDAGLGPAHVATDKGNPYEAVFHDETLEATLRRVLAGKAKWFQWGGKRAPSTARAWLSSTP